MRVHANTYWDDQGSRDYLEIQKFGNDVELLDKAHKRAKRELSKQQKAITRKNELIKCYKEMYDNLVKQYNRLNTILVAFQDSKMAIVELRNQLNETEEKYNDLLKQLINEK